MFAHTGVRSSFFFDLHALVFLFPAGLYFCFKRLTDANIFIILYAITSVYFAVRTLSTSASFPLLSPWQGVMVRLMLVLAPIACITSAIAIAGVAKAYMRWVHPDAKPKKVPRVYTDLCHYSVSSFFFLRSVTDASGRRDAADPSRGGVRGGAGTDGPPLLLHLPLHLGHLRGLLLALHRARRQIYRRYSSPSHFTLKSTRPPSHHVANIMKCNFFFFLPRFL